MKVVIENFKSIKHLEINLARINILIGPPASGKSNILEALAFANIVRKIAEYSVGEIISKQRYYYTEDIGKLLDKGYAQYLRLPPICNILDTDEDKLLSLFFGKRWDKEIRIEIDGTKIIFSYDMTNRSFKIKHDLLGEYYLKEIINYFSSEKEGAKVFLEKEIPIRLYRSPINFENFYSTHYLIEFGTEISKFIRRFQEEINNILTNLHLFIITTETGPKFVDLQLKKDFPYDNLSDGIKRLIYILCAIKSNDVYYKPSLVLLEEPEIHVYPYYLDEIVKFIVNTEKTTFIITTHNEDFIRRLIIYIKTQKEDLLKETKIFYIDRDPTNGTYIKEELIGEDTFKRTFGPII